MLQSVDDLTFSLRHGLDIPGLDLYDAGLWNDIVRTYHSSWGLEAPCRCDSCTCDGCKKHGQLGQCEYRYGQRRQNLCCDGYSSDGEEYLTEGELDEDEGLEEGLGEDPGEYLTEPPHNMLTSVRMYAMGDMFCVPALQVLARNRFYKAVERNMKPFVFSEAVDEILKRQRRMIGRLRMSVFYLFGQGVLDLARM